MTTVSVPGKLILLGEHAAVYGRPALVAAVGLRLRVTVQDAGAAPGCVRFRLSDSGETAEAPWAEVLAHARSAREAWEAYDAAPGPAAFAALAEPARLRGALHLLQVALGEAARELGEDDVPGSLPSFDVAVTSEIPIGSGFGSSAAAAVAVVTAYLAHRGADTDPRRLHRVSLEVERRLHGSPSGVDNATVLHGGVLEARKLPSGEVSFQGVPVVSSLLGSLRVLGTGRPAEGTGTVVAAVRALRDREPARVEAVLDRLAELAGRLREELEREGERPEEVLEIVRGAEEGLEALDVVPEPVQELVRRVEAEGGAAKVSGAGALTGHGAGNLLVYHPEPDRIATWGFLAGCERYAVELGVPGARVERGQEAGEAGSPETVRPGAPA
ncbi:MAG TPA: hypothetical protein VLF66_13275 [Thermoanaerobaculia bacterium]|nr:hypothetical protein [Thermoanaerobaculia bacterium]